MANTRKSTKRAKQTVKRQARNTLVRSETKTTLKGAIQALAAKDVAKAKSAYALAVKALGKAASKGAIPAARASRKISRLTKLVKRALPNVLASK